MRLIGHLPNEASAATFSDYLYVQGITNEVERERDGWAVWIHSEDELAQAREMLAGFLGNPGDPKFQKHSKQANQLKEQAEKAEAAAEKRFFDRKRIFRSTAPYGIGLFTFLLILASLAVGLWSKFGADMEFLNNLFITQIDSVGRYTPGFPEIRRGEIWRLFSPVFIHFGVLHLILNMLWLFDLGSMIESRQGVVRLLLLVVVIAALSNLGQYYSSHPLFGGMSGVVYGLLGYVWMKGRYDPASGLYLHPQTVMMMLAWFFICWTPLIEVFGNIRIANVAHGVGLVVGMAWGYFSSLRASRA
jgi:GlpG protein